MVTQRARRLALIALLVLLAATAIAGGLSLIVGWIQLPHEWLDGSPFRSYTIPGVVLMIVVGGSAIAALVALLAGHLLDAVASTVAGIMIMGFEVVEVLIVGSEPGLMRNLQIFYFLLGSAITALATWPWTSEHAAELRHPRPPVHTGA